MSKDVFIIYKKRQLQNDVSEWSNFINISHFSSLAALFPQQKIIVAKYTSLIISLYESQYTCTVFSCRHSLVSFIIDLYRVVWIILDYQDKNSHDFVSEVKWQSGTYS